MAPIFFVSAGFFVDINVFQTDLPMLLTVIVMAVVGKIFGTALFYLPTGHGWREGITVGAGMNGRGAVEIIIAGIGLEMGIIDSNIFSILVFMAIFTTMTVPLLLKWTTNWLRKRGELVYIGHRTDILLLGANPISLLLAEYLKDEAPILMIDTNRESVNQARRDGFKCIHGNVLKEEVLAEAHLEKVNTFIGLTSNSEVNMLAAQMARGSYLIPNNYVAISRNEDGAGMDLLESVQATSLFAMKIPIDEWFLRISNNEFETITETVDESMVTQAWLRKRKDKHENILPLIIEDTEGHKRPFHYDDMIEEGEKVMYLK